MVWRMLLHCTSGSSGDHACIRDFISVPHISPRPDRRCFSPASQVGHLLKFQVLSGTFTEAWSRTCEYDQGLSEDDEGYFNEIECRLVHLQLL